MKPCDVGARHGEHPEWIRVAEVVFPREGKAAQVGERADVAALDAREALAVQGNPLLHVRDECPQALELECLEPLTGHRLELGLEDHDRSISRLRAIVLG